MTPENTLDELRRNIQRILTLAGDHRITLSESAAVSELKRLLQRVIIAGQAMAANTESKLALEFISIIESHPKLRKASNIAVQQELLEICNDGLQYFAKLSTTRPLSTDEMKRLQVGKDMHFKCKNELDELLREFLN